MRYEGEYREYMEEGHRFFFMEMKTDSGPHVVKLGIDKDYWDKSDEYRRNILVQQARMHIVERIAAAILPEPYSDFPGEGV